MEFLFTAKEIKEVDRLTITEFGIPSFTLLESASRVVADIIEKRVEGKRVWYYAEKEIMAEMA